MVDRQTGKRIRQPKQKRARDKYDAILRAAMRVLAEEGYSKTSTVKIAQVAGVSVGSVYAYFSDKDAIFSAYVHARIGEIFQLISGNLSTWRYDTVEEAVRGVVTESVAFTASNRKSLSAMIGKIPGVYDGAMMRDVMQQLYTVAEAFYIKQNLVQNSDQARRMTYTLTNATIGFFIRVVSDPDIPLDKQELIEELVTLIMGYIHERQRIAKS